jgi:hypothetical protein
MKKKINVIGEVQSGFDTEYVPYDWGQNILISAQLSTSTCVKIKVPIRKSFVFEGVNTATGETYLLSAPLFKAEGMYESTIESLIVSCREILFPGHDAGIVNVCNYLIDKRDKLNIGNIVLNENGYVFMTDISDIKNTIILPKAGEDLIINFDTLTSITNRVALTDIELQKSLFGKIINSVSKFTQEDNFGFELKPAWSNKFINSLKTETYILSNEENEAAKEKFKLYRSNTDLTSFKTRTYLISHYNAADLGMIADWAEVSFRNIDVLKKSFTSLNAPIISLGLEVHIRDSILLSSAAASSLDAVGKAYGLSKVVIPKKYYSMMDILLKDNYNLFEAYAMQDSLISLVHALFMNLFVFKLSDLKIPNTLGSISSKYLKQKWQQDGYRGYQVDNEFLLGETDNHNPLGISNLGLTGESLNQFIGSYRGGRNECFKYGIDTTKR